MTKADAIALMLENYNDARETLNGPRDYRDGDGGAGPMNPPTWTPEYEELERCLLKLREQDRPTFAHVQERYLANQQYNEVVRTISVNQRGNPIPPNNTKILCVLETRKHTARVRLRRWHSWVSRERLNIGLRQLAEDFQGEPSVSRQLLAAA